METSKIALLPGNKPALELIRTLTCEECDGELFAVRVRPVLGGFVIMRFDCKACGNQVIVEPDIR